jgi:hypothetical protein
MCSLLQVHRERNEMLAEDAQAIRLCETKKEGMCTSACILEVACNGTFTWESLPFFLVVPQCRCNFEPSENSF